MDTMGNRIKWPLYLTYKNKFTYLTWSVSLEKNNVHNTTAYSSNKTTYIYQPDLYEGENISYSTNGNLHRLAVAAAYHTKQPF